MRRSNWLKNTIGAIIVVPLFAALAGCGGGITTGVSGKGDGGGGVGGNGSGASVNTAILSWDAPTNNSDGSVATDLSGFKVYYGTSNGYYSNSVDAGLATTYTLTNLTAGATYYFVITAYDSAGVESDPSIEVSKTF